MPVEMHAEMRLRLDRHLAFEAGDRIAPVTTRQPDLVAEVMDRPVAHLGHRESFPAASNPPLQVQAFRDDLVCLIKVSYIDQLAGQGRAGCESQHGQHSLPRLRPSGPCAGDGLPETAGEHQGCGWALLVPDPSFLSSACQFSPLLANLQIWLPL